MIFSEITVQLISPIHPYASAGLLWLVQSKLSKAKCTLLAHSVSFQVLTGPTWIASKSLIFSPHGTSECEQFYDFLQMMHQMRENDDLRFSTARNTIRGSQVTIYDTKQSTDLFLIPFRNPVSPITHRVDQAE